MHVDQERLDRTAAEVVSRFPFSGYFDPHLNGQITVAETVSRYLPPGSRVLDFGAGPCDKTAILSKVGYRCTAVDDLDDVWHKRGRAREMILDFAREMDINFIVSNGEMPKFSEEFDMVMLHHVLEHLHDSPRDLLLALLEHLREGGYLFISVPNHVNLRKRLAVLRGRTSLPAYQHYYWYPGPWRGHIREYTKGDCIALAEALQLEIVELRGVHNMLEKVPSPLRGVYDTVTRLMPSVRDTWSLVARKPSGWVPKHQLNDDELQRLTGVRFWTDDESSDPSM